VKPPLILILALPLLFVEPCRAQGVAIASFERFSDKGRIAANGRPYNPNFMTCATRRWPIGSLLRITDVHNGNWVIVAVSDRTPRKWASRLDLSPRAFMCLNGLSLGICEVKVEVLFRTNPYSATQSTSPASPKRTTAALCPRPSLRQTV
jgi:rare lipoprotein A